MNKPNKYLIVISIDALNANYFNYVKELPTFKSFILDGSYIRNLYSIYPSLTYPCHTSIITGTYPNRHGIVSNKKCQPKRYKNPEWYWYEKSIKVPTIFDYASKQQYTCASILWPVMAGASIPYNIPELWPVEPSFFIKDYIKNSSGNLIIPALKNIRLSCSLQPSLDNMADEVSNYLILNKQPNLLFIHFTQLDYATHRLGTKSNKVQDILKKIDSRIQRLIDSTKKANIYDKTNFILLGDHGMNDYENYICINSFFKEKKLIITDAKNRITSWKAFCNSCGGSAQICINSKEDKQLYKNVYAQLMNLLANPESGIKHVYTSEESNRLFHLDNSFQFVLEAKDGYVFDNHICNQLVIPRTRLSSPHIANHGFLPTHPNMRTLLFAKGIDIRNTHIQQATLVDIAPTISRIMNLSMKELDGSCLSSILKHS